MKGKLHGCQSEGEVTLVIQSEGKSNITSDSGGNNIPVKSLEGGYDARQSDRYQAHTAASHTVEPQPCHLRAWGNSFIICRGEANTPLTDSLLDNRLFKEADRTTRYL